MRKRTATLLFVGLAFLVSASSGAAGANADSARRTAAAPSATLDTSFGTDGLLRLPNEGIEDAHAAALSSGDFIVRGRSGLLVLSSSGGSGASFGGSSRLNPAPGTDEFRVEDFALDAAGRLLLVGTGFPSDEEAAAEGTNEGQVSLGAADAEIVRLLPDGRLDPTFGQGGVVETDFGLPPPHDGEGLPLIARASVGAGGVAVDSHGRIVVTGEAAIGIGASCQHDIFQSVAVGAPFIARLTENGTPDPTFSGDGVVGGRNLSETPLGSASLGPPAVSPDGTITYRSTGIWRCGGRYGVAQLTADGQVRKGLGRKGAVGGYFRALASDPDGSVLAVARMGWTEGEHFKARVVRITPKGRIDRSFGRDGQAVVRLGALIGNEPDSIAIDPRGRILLDGTLVTAKGRSIFLARLSADGHQEMDFGPNGRVATALPSLVSFGPGDALFDPKGRLLTMHRYKSAHGTGFVLARFLLQN